MKEVYILVMLTHVSFVLAIADNSSLMSSNLTWLADMLQKLCPGADICSESRTSEAPVVTFLPGYGSCCVDCSCGPNCEVDGNCCFPDTKSSQEQFYDTLHPESVCLFPSTVQPSENGRYMHQYYEMISSVPQPFEDQAISKTNVSCGEEKVAPWGSLYPVYSAERKRIYKNIACAEADDVTDGVLWDARLHCAPTLDLFVDVTSYVIGLESNFTNERCQVDFIYPGDNDDLRSLICYVDLLDSCEVDDFTIPDVINVSHREVKTACKSGLASPYRNRKMFANVFCLICNAEIFSSNSQCKVPKDNKKRRPSLPGFTSLIDSNFISDTRRIFTGNYVNIIQACTVPATNGPKVTEYDMEYQLKDSIKASSVNQFALADDVKTGVLNNWFTGNHLVTFCSGALETGSTLFQLMRTVFFIRLCVNRTLYKWCVLGNEMNIKGRTVKQVLNKGCKPLSMLDYLGVVIRKCRKLFCPSGQLRDSNGQCRYPSKLWYGQDYFLPIDLTAEEGIDIQQIFQAQPVKNTQILPDMTNPWQKNWVITFVFYEDLCGNRNITNLLVILKKTISQVRPDQFLKNIKNNVNRTWTLRYDNVTTVLKSKISKYAYLSQRRESEIIIGNRSETILRPVFTMIYSQTEKATNEFVISKLFWCEQVELTQSDFILSLDKTVLFNRITKRFMNNGEFILIEVDFIDNITARICIEDSGMHRADRITFSNGSLLFELHPVWFPIFMIVGNRLVPF